MNTISLSRPQYIIHQKPGTGTHRWEIGRRLRGRGTDKCFGENLTKGEAECKAREVNAVVEEFVQQKAIAAAQDGLKEWAQATEELVGNVKGPEVEEMWKLRDAIVDYLKRVPSVSA